MLSVNRLGGYALIVGSVLAFIMFLLQPGGLLIDNVPPSDAAGVADAAMSNAGLTKATSLLVGLALVVLAYGVYATRAMTRGAAGDGLAQAGTALIAFGVITWVLAQALLVSLADAGLSADSLDAVFSIRLSLLMIGGVIISPGLLLFSLGVGQGFASMKWSKLFTWLMALSAVVGLAGWVWAAADSANVDSGVTISRSVYIIQVLWFVYIGTRLLKQDDAT